jgi:hypothetical protein
MATCPSGHESASDDFCDVCGFRIGDPTGYTPVDPAITPPGGSVAAAPAPGSPAAPAAPAPGRPACPNCGAARTGQFCESCGYNFATAAGPGSASAPTRLEPIIEPRPAPLLAKQPPDPQPVPPPSPVPPPPAAALPPDAATWTAVVTADRAYFESVLATVGPDAPELSFPAYCPERRFRLSGTEVRVGRRSVSRGIDPEIDLTGPPSDPGISRLHALLIAQPGGTWSVIDPGSQNGMLVNGNEIPPNQAVPLHDGDRIHLGAWTALTITRG